LGRRTKNNPVLIGDPGVGKTAIVEGLAQAIVAEEVPDHLVDKHVIMLDLAGMVAGTKYRGEFEGRIKKLVDELSKDEQAIVFVDELHLLVGAGAAEGTMDAANMLKPALARGSLRMIGATTLEEYQKYIEKDSALERRFQTITVPEPDAKTSAVILRGLKGHYEKHHGVSVADEVADDIAYLAKRYISERYMPDKAIDVLDETAAQVRSDRGKTSPEVRKLANELKLVTERMEDAVGNEDYERAAQYKTRMSQINDKLEKLRTNHANGQKLVVTSSDVARTIASMTGIPVQRVLKAEANYFLGLEKHLQKQIVGQPDAITAVARAIRRSRSGIGGTGRPIGSFIFMGPTGVGKTALAKVLAQEVFGSDKSMIKIDMSEFGERHATARLVGAPAGYVGYNDSNQLTDRVRRQPYSLVLFDEIEKAHPEVLNILLQILEDGRLTDARGRHIDFSNTIIILTSNLGAESMRHEAALGFRAKSKQDLDELSHLHDLNSEAALDNLKQLMRPEIINRFDKVVVFKALSKQDTSKILDLQLEDLNQRLQRRGVKVICSPTAKKLLLEKGYDVQNGARPLRRAIQDMIEDEIADGLLADRYTKGSIIKVGARQHELTFGLVTE